MKVIAFATLFVAGSAIQRTNEGTLHPAYTSFAHPQDDVVSDNDMSLKRKEKIKKNNVNGKMSLATLKSEQFQRSVLYHPVYTSFAHSQDGLVSENDLFLKRKEKTQVNNANGRVSLATLKFEQLQDVPAHGQGAGDICDTDDYCRAIHEELTCQARGGRVKICGKRCERRDQCAQLGDLCLDSGWCGRACEGLTQAKCTGKCQWVRNFAGFLGENEGDKCVTTLGAATARVTTLGCSNNSECENKFGDESKCILGRPEVVAYMGAQKGFLCQQIPVNGSCGNRTIFRLDTPEVMKYFPAGVTDRDGGAVSAVCSRDCPSLGVTDCEIVNGCALVEGACQESPLPSYQSLHEVDPRDFPASTPTSRFESAIGVLQGLELDAELEAYDQERSQMSGRPCLPCARNTGWR